MNSEILLAGDWHEDAQWAAECVEKAGAAGIKDIYHLGDFGIGLGDLTEEGQSFEQEVNEACEKADVDIWVTAGNHENYQKINASLEGKTGWGNIESRIHVARRGHVFEVGGARVGSLGGAVSLDRGLRVKNYDWWEEEEIRTEDVMALTANMRAKGWDRLDVLLTHDAPAGGEPRRSGSGWIPPEVLQAVDYSRLLLRKAVEATRPRSLAHGHWHEAHERLVAGVADDGTQFECEILGLDLNGKAANLATGRFERGKGITNFTRGLAAVAPVKEKPGRTLGA